MYKISLDNTFTFSDHNLPEYLVQFCYFSNLYLNKKIDEKQLAEKCKELINHCENKPTLFKHKPFKTLTVLEGNIAAGKTTYLNNKVLSKTKIDEPIKYWSEIKLTNGMSIFEMFYQAIQPKSKLLNNDERGVWVFIFELFALITRVFSLLKSLDHAEDYIIERCFLSDRYQFQNFSF